LIGRENNGNKNRQSQPHAEPAKPDLSVSYLVFVPTDSERQETEKLKKDTFLSAFLSNGINIFFNLLSLKLIQIIVKNLLPTSTKTQCVSIHMMPVYVWNHKQALWWWGKAEFIVLNQVVKIVTTVLYVNITGVLVSP
jgi:hypothetical protein